MVNKMILKNNLIQEFILKTAVEKAVFRSGNSLSDVLSSFRYSRETHPSGSDTHGCLPAGRQV